jgi:hypothetical protein
MNPTETTTPATPPDRLERALRAGLRPVDPGAAFTAALQARLATTPRQALTVVRAPLRNHRLHVASLALAASIVVALGIGAQLAELRTEQQAEQARIHSQLLVALEITSEHLGLAQQRIEQFQAQEKNP